MNCDDVFEELTRGPFPSGQATDAAIEAHLAACPGCRRLAQVFAPAVTLLHESLHAEECQELPAYWGEWLREPAASAWSASASRAVEDAVDDTGSLRPSGPRAGSASWWAVATLILCSMGLGWSLAQPIGHGPSGPGAWGTETWEGSFGSDRDSASALFSGSEQGVLSREALGLTLACLTRAHGSPAVTQAVPITQVDPKTQAVPEPRDAPPAKVVGPTSRLELAQLQCCTLCHAVDRTHRQAMHVTRLARSCRLCHVAVH